MGQCESVSCLKVTYEMPKAPPSEKSSFIKSKSEKMTSQPSFPPILLDAERCKGLAFTAEERKHHHLEGYLPPSVRTVELQIEAVIQNIRRLKEDNLSKFMLLRNLQDYNTRLFYLTMAEHTEELLPIVYTPTVGAGCINYSFLFSRPRGMFLSINDKGNLSRIFKNWFQEDVKAIVVTDGERILGLGDLGTNGMGIPVGKLALYTALGGVDPSKTLPITLDVGTNIQKVRDDPFYIGLKQDRIKGAEYDDFMDEFMKAVVQRYGETCLIQFEDFGNHNAFMLLDRYKEKYCTFNDDIQGTSSVALAGVLSSTRITGLKLSEQSFLFLGAGEAALGTAELIVLAMLEEGLSEEEALKKIWMIDSKGLIVASRSSQLTKEKKRFAQEFDAIKGLVEIIKQVKPSTLFGLSAQAGAFNQEVIETMAELNERPVIFALSNPTHKAECTAEDAYTHSKGKAIFASGSPFSPVTFNGETFHPGQGNNAYIFPGIALAALGLEANRISDKVFLVSAQVLAQEVSQKDLDLGRLYPSLSEIPNVSIKIASQVGELFYKEGVTMIQTKPKNLQEFFKKIYWSPSYN